MPNTDITHFVKDKGRSDCRNGRSNDI